MGKCLPIFSYLKIILTNFRFCAPWQTAAVRVLLLVPVSRHGQSGPTREPRTLIVFARRNLSARRERLDSTHTSSRREAFRDEVQQSLFFYFFIL